MTVIMSVSSRGGTSGFWWMTKWWRNMNYPGGQILPHGLQSKTPSSQCGCWRWFGRTCDGCWGNFIRPTLRGFTTSALPMSHTYIPLWHHLPSRPYLAFCHAESLTREQFPLFLNIKSPSGSSLFKSWCFSWRFPLYEKSTVFFSFGFHEHSFMGSTPNGFIDRVNTKTIHILLNCG